MQVLFNISEKETDLKQELIFIIENQLTNASAGLQNRGSKLLEKLNKSLIRK